MLPWFQYTTINLGPIPIQVWGLFVALGMLLSVYIIWKRANSKGLDPETLVDMSIWSIIAGVLGARIVHIFFYEPAFFIANPIEIFKVWHGGLSSFGGLFGAIFGGHLFIKKKKANFDKYKLTKIGDIMAFAAVYGWVVGRVGCVAIHDHLGMRCNCFLAINTQDGPRLEMALLEIIFMIPLAIIFFVSRKKEKPAGWFLNILFVYYGVLRFVLDFFRATDIFVQDVRYLGLTPAQYFSILLVLLGVRFFYKSRTK